MCRLFALRSNQPTRVRGSLVQAPHSLYRQSICDAQQQSHDNGWGIGYYQAGRVVRVRSPQPADQDPHFRELADAVVTPTVIAHIRRASMGEVVERNSHPFLHKQWLFAHNGTLFGFTGARERLRSLIPDRLLQGIEGDTDSEHAFYLFLARLEQRAGSLDGPADPEAARLALVETIRTLEDLCPGEGSERSQFNFVVTDGRQVLASRWRHRLSWIERRGQDPANPDRPLDEGADYHAVAIASEPTTTEAWSEVPDRTILHVHPDLTHTLTPVPG